MCPIFSSCFVSQLEKHLERCNSKPQPLPEYIQTNVNLVEGNGEEEEIKVVLGNLSDEELLAFISKFEKTHSGRSKDTPVESFSIIAHLHL